jgi:glycosyltransferase involved in cell wall biosynthesis
MAIEEFARRRPDLKIHLYGGNVGRVPLSFIDHGAVSPSELNSIYNQCYAGLSLSFTNVSLVPHEMLAAGCIPVVNEAEHNRIVLDNQYVRYAAPNPHALASELEAIVNMSEFDSHSIAAASSVQSANWGDAGYQVDAILRKALMESP